MTDSMLDNMNSDELLDMTLDDLEDLPTFEPYPAGAHKVLMTLALKTINDKQSVEAVFKLVETMELAEPLKDGEKAPVEGAETSVLCQLDNEWGRGNLKLLATPVGVAMGIGNIRQVVEECNDIEVIIVTWVQVSKKDGVARTKVKELVVV